MRRFFTLFIMLMLSGVLAFSQSRVVTGTIKDNTGAPIEGASVRVRGSRSGVAADAQGNFRISVLPGATLVFSGVGINTQEVAVGNQTSLNVTLTRNSTELTNVTVVTGLGIRRAPRELGYSTANVSGTELNEAKPVNAVTGLVGKVSGLDIQIADNSINPTVRATLRGNRSILGNNQALFIVDGLQVDNSYVARLNPDDIESVNVLKGASASAIYGSNASNGVIVYTTKKGTRGTPRINYTSTVQQETISYMPDLQTRFGSYGGEPYNDALSLHLASDPIHIYSPFENQSYGPEFTGQMVPLGGPARFYRADGSFYDSTRMVPYSAIPNGKRNFFDHGITDQNNLSFSTGDATSLLYISLQHVDVHGIIPKDQSTRNTVRVNGMKQYGKFRADYNVSYAGEKINQVDNATNYDGGGYPLYWEILNQPQQVDFSYFKDWQNNPFASPSYYYNAYYGNPYWYIDQNRDITINHNFIGSLKLAFQFTNWLNLSYTVGYSRNDQSYSNQRAAPSYDPYATTDPWGEGMIASSGNKLISAAETNYFSYSNRISSDLLLTAAKNFGNFSTKLILGNSMYKRESGLNYVNTPSLVVNGLYNINYLLNTPIVNQQYIAEGLIGVFGDLTLGYKNFLFLHATGRNDWNSKLAPANRSFFYPSADVSFVFTDAIPSLKNNRILSYGEVRIADSKVGQVSVNPYSLDNLAFSGAGFPYGTQAGFTISNTFANPALKPEFTNEQEAGVELRFLNNRLGFKATYYNQKTTNQTIPTQISSSTGFTAATVNLGSMTNKGIELDLALTPLLNLGPVKWNFGVNFAYNKNTVGQDIGGELSLGNNVYATPGLPYPNLKVSDWVRDSATGKVIVDPTTGFPTKAGPLISAGTTVAPYKLGLNTSFTYKSLTLSAVADAQFGGVIFNSIGQSLMFTGIDAYSAQAGRQPFVYPNSEVLQNGKYVPNNNVLVNTAYTSGEWRFWSSTFNAVGSPFVSSSDYWKIREIALTWSIPRKLTRSIKIIQAATLSLSGRNLFMFRAKDNVWTDPEFTSITNLSSNGISTGVGNNVGSTNYYQTPPTRIYGATLNVTF